MAGIQCFGKVVFAGFVMARAVRLFRIAWGAFSSACSRWLVLPESSTLPVLFALSLVSPFAAIPVVFWQHCRCYGLAACRWKTTNSIYSMAWNYSRVWHSHCNTVLSQNKRNNNKYLSASPKRQRAGLNINNNKMPDHASTPLTPAVKSGGIYFSRHIVEGCQRQAYSFSCEIFKLTLYIRTITIIMKTLS